MTKLDVRASLECASREGPAARGISTMAKSLVGSEILKIAGEIRAMIARGDKVLNLTVGDFSPKEFPIPRALHAGIVRALEEGNSNYPPSEGVLDTREAVRELYAKRLGVEYPIESVLIAGGSRPMIAGTYLALLDPGDAVVYGLPSWNNNHYCVLSGAEKIEVPTRAEDGFFPRAEQLRPHVARARLLCICTPSNPTGTVMDAGRVEEIARLVVDENKKRAKDNKPALYLMWDQVYWMLTFKGVVHHNPVALVPEVAPYTIFIDGISKALSATGVRVGWAVGPTDVIKRMSALLTHIGAWAPRAEQVATARLLRDEKAVDEHLTKMNAGLFARLEALSSGIHKLKKAGFDVDCIAPQGAIYLSLRINMRGRKTSDGTLLATDEDVRTYVLREAGVALVGFQAFGLREDSGWFRASVGAVSVDECTSIGERLKKAFDKLL